MNIELNLNSMWYVGSDVMLNMFFICFEKWRERTNTVTLFYFCGLLLEDYCKWQRIHYLDGIRRAESTFHKPRRVRHHATETT